MERTPLLRGATLTWKSPWIWGIPIALDLGKLLLAWLLAQFSLYWVEWDFSVAYPLQLGHHLLYVSLPAALPSAEGLGLPISPPVTATATAVQWSALVLFFLLSSVLRGGYLNLLNCLVHDVPPAWPAFLRGVKRFSVRMGTLSLLWLLPAIGLQQLLEMGRLGPNWVACALLLLAAWFGVAQFVMVTDDVGPIRGLLGLPLVLAEQGILVLTALSASVVLTGGVSLLLTALHLTSSLWGVLPQAVLGTWLAVSLLDALQIGISTQGTAKRRGPWACAHCLTQNMPRASHCVACGCTPKCAEPDATNTTLLTKTSMPS